MDIRKMIAAVAVLFVWCTDVTAQQPEEVDGYPLSNFALTVNASQNGGFFGQIMRNPGRIGEWLQDKGGVEFFVEKDGRRHRFSEFRKKTVERAFPFVSNTYHGSPLTKTSFAVTAFCPLAVNDARTSALPLLMVEMECANTRRTAEAFDIVAVPAEGMAQGMSAVKGDGYSGAGDGKCVEMTADVPTSWDGSALRMHLSLGAKEKRMVRILLVFHDDEWVSALDYSSPDMLTAYGRSVWPVLKDKTEGFSRAIPVTGDDELDSFLRWYMVSGVSLTKWTRNNEVVTMGYRELNQRDSYWTSWLHLVMFKDMERRMIEESIEWLQPSGKIPTTILPLIERDDDLDINAFFILRVARFWQMYHERQNLQTYWPALKKAMEWLISRDKEHVGLPMQVSFWGDWKDVGGVEGRKYSPFSCLVYMAALKKMELMAEVCGDSTAADEYAGAYDRAFRRVNMDVKDGGLWNGEYYCQIWRDGSVNDRLLQDQTIGILFGVVPDDRAAKIFGALNERSLTPYGIAETFPYYDESFGYPPATYHNGAVWPWVSFMDCWARVRMGRRAEAVELVKRVGRADLVDSGDWSPNEHINSLTGENLGFHIQGWNAGLFGLVYFGLVNTGVID